MIVGDKATGMLESIPEVFPEAKYQCCTVHHFRNVLSAMSRTKMKIVSKMLKVIHASECKVSAKERVAKVAEQLKEMKIHRAAKKIEDGIDETLTYIHFLMEHWTRIRTNNTIEHLNREIRRRTKVVGTFLDGNSALMRVCARLRYVVGTQWGVKK